MAVLVLPSMALQAEDLPDPTRPAAGLIAPSGEAANGTQPLPTDDGLKTIIISPDRRSAIINGQQVPLGGKLENERLMAVCEDHVVLQGVDGKREVPLYPDVLIQGRRSKNCVTPAAKQSTGASLAPKKKIKKIGHAPAAGAAKKKEKSCK